MKTPPPLSLFVRCLQKVHDPRSKQGQSHQFSTVLALIFLGLLAKISTLAELQRWSELHFHELKTLLRFKNDHLPHAITFARILRKLSLDELQLAFAEFVNALMQNQPLIAAVDGKTAKQIKDENGNPIHMLNVFAQTIKLHLASWQVNGNDKTNEPGCLKQHLEELFEIYPCLQLLTGDAIFAQRSLLEAIREYHRDYLVQVKENQPKVLTKMKEVFQDATQETSHDYDRRVNKKRGL